MERINIYITETQALRFRLKAKTHGIKFSELVRRALDAWLESEDTKEKEQSHDRPKA